MTMLSTPRNVAFPKASKAFPVSVPGPHIVLAMVGTGSAVEKVVHDVEDKVLDKVCDLRHGMLPKNYRFNAMIGDI
jgi:hypothetical protein